VLEGLLRGRRLTFGLMVQPEALRGFLERAGTAVLSPAAWSWAGGRPISGSLFLTVFKKNRALARQSGRIPAIFRFRTGAGRGAAGAPPGAVRERFKSGLPTR